MSASNYAPVWYCLNDECIGNGKPLPCAYCGWCEDEGRDPRNLVSVAEIETELQAESEADWE